MKDFDIFVFAGTLLAIFGMVVAVHREDLFLLIGCGFYLIWFQLQSIKKRIKE